MLLIVIANRRNWPGDRTARIREALRLAPSVQVARIDSNKWAIGLRGFRSIVDATAVDVVMTGFTNALDGNPSRGVPL